MAAHRRRVGRNKNKPLGANVKNYEKPMKINGRIRDKKNSK